MDVNVENCLLLLKLTFKDKVTLFGPEVTVGRVNHTLICEGSIWRMYLFRFHYSALFVGHFAISLIRQYLGTDKCPGRVNED